MIKLRGNTWWSDIRIGGARVRQSLHTADRAEAMRRLGDLLEEQSTGAAAVKLLPGGTLGDALTTTWNEHWSELRNSKMPSLIHNVRSTFGNDVPLCRIDRAALKEYQKKLQGMGKSNATINRYVVCITKAMRWMKDEHKKPVDVPTVPMMTEDNSVTRYLLEDEIKALLQAEQNDRWRLFWRFQMELGARLSDGIKTPWSNFDWARGLWLCKHSKTKTPVNLPMAADLAADLKALMDAGESRPFPWVADTATKRFNLIRTKAGLSDDVTLHVLRHTCATYLLERGADIRVVQVWLGHKHIQTTMRYAKVTPKALMQYRPVSNSCDQTCDQNSNLGTNEAEGTE